MTIEAPESLHAVVGRIQRLDAGRLQAVMRLVGLRDPGNRILDDLVAACRPRRMTVVGDFSVRGGITTEVTATYERP